MKPEIKRHQDDDHNGSPSVRGAWIETGMAMTYRTRPESLPVRGAWIEILKPFCRARPERPEYYRCR